MGDFNIDYLNHTPSHLYSRFVELSDSFDLQQVVNDPTHLSHLGNPSIIMSYFLIPLFCLLVRYPSYNM